MSDGTKEQLRREIGEMYEVMTNAELQEEREQQLKEKEKVEKQKQKHGV